MLFWQCFALFNVAQLQDNTRGTNTRWFGRAEFAIRNANPVSLAALATAATAAIGGGIKLGYDYFASVKEVELSYEDKVAAPTSKPHTLSHIDYICTVDIPTDWNTCAPSSRSTSLESPSDHFAITTCIIPQTTDIIRIPRPRKAPFLTPSDIFQRYEDAFSAFDTGASETMWSKLARHPVFQMALSRLLDVIVAVILVLAWRCLVKAYRFICSRAPDVYMYASCPAASYETMTEHLASNLVPAIMAVVPSRREAFVYQGRLATLTTMVVPSVCACENSHIPWAFFKFATRNIPRTLSHLFEPTMFLLRAVFAVASGRGIVLRQSLANLSRLLMLGASPDRFLDVLTRVARTPTFCLTKDTIIANICRIEQGKKGKNIEKHCATLYSKQHYALIVKELAHSCLTKQREQERLRLSEEQERTRIAEELERKRTAEQQNRQKGRGASRLWESNEQPKRDKHPSRTRGTISHGQQRREQRNRMHKNKLAQSHPEEHEPTRPRPRPTMQADKAATSRMLSGVLRTRS
ncbi:hypothetical protein CYLTODRAFT_456355 [Cylindrobasidium torrendii FP15055 ss-10]|uniref:Uncharacterized protein n=1 Tax=Cylindrobasidium torrendii FP15055 ss-10 TaxID=1314674 RepID=A0A0D7B784_9AGAR|nr:hypothetical protein CYLTODRAFT_456355 [Cylindrobasidium torrendii FP15055 ss-10]